MKKSFSLVLVLSVLSTMGYAQANLDNEVDAELNKMYSSGSDNKAATAAQTSTAPVSGQPIYILNQATPTATSQSTSAAAAVQKQPTTVIEASPLTESRAEALRKARQDAETSTEAKIVEKLEASRLEDEKRRAQILFGSKLDNGVNAETAPAAQAAPVAPAVAPVQAAPVPQIYLLPAPAPVEAKKEEPVVSTAVEKEVEAAAQVESTMSVAVPAPVTSEKYFMGLVGVPMVDSDDIQGNYSLGFTFGNKYDDSFAVEGSFIYSNYEAKNVNNYWYTGRPDLFDVNQYSGSVATKWYLLKGMVKPLIGGLAQYSYRDFQWSDKNYVTPYNLGKSESHAVDIGLITGVEIQFNPNMTVGLDARYYKNVMVRRNYATDNLNNSYYQNAVNSQYGYRTPVENLDYFTWSLSARVSF